MTIEEVGAIVFEQSTGSLTVTNDPRMNLEQALVPPERISVISRHVKDGRVRDKEIFVWLVGKEKNRTDGYKIVMREDGLQFGLASNGFPHDRYPVLAGWYGGLVSAFLSM